MSIIVVTCPGRRGCTIRDAGIHPPPLSLGLHSLNQVIVLRSDISNARRYWTAVNKTSMTLKDNWQCVWKQMKVTHRPRERERDEHRIVGGRPWRRIGTSVQCRPTVWNVERIPANQVSSLLAKWARRVWLDHRLVVTQADPEERPARLGAPSRRRRRFTARSVLGQSEVVTEWRQHQLELTTTGNLRRFVMNIIIQLVGGSK